MYSHSHGADRTKMKNLDDHNKLIEALQGTLGEIVSLEEKSDLVYYLCAKKNETDVFPQEYYVVGLAAAAISSTAKRYGRPVAGLPQFRYFSIDDPYSGWRIIAYEIWRYKLQNHLPVDGSESLHEFAIHCAEYHPEYFGAYPAPVQTPYGPMVRYQVIENGICFLETDTGQELVSFSFPIWQTLSGYTQKIGRQTTFDLEHGIENTKGYLFFTKEYSCLPFFELWAEYRWHETKLFDLQAMMNAIWEYFPEYAATYNAVEQKGSHDLLNTLVNLIDMEELDISIRPEKMISITPGAGTKFFKLDPSTDHSPT